MNNEIEKTEDEKLINEIFEEYDDVFTALVNSEELDSDDNFDKLTTKNFQKYDSVFRELAKSPK